MAVDYGDQLRRNSVRSPNSVALIDFGKEVTYENLNQRVNRLANGLAQVGVRRGDRVAVIADNSGVPVETMLACAKGGFVYVPIDFRLGAQDALVIFSDCEPAAVVVDDAYHDVAQEIRPYLPSETIWLSTAPVQVDSFASYHDLIEFSSTAEPVSGVVDTDLFCIIYTSGTTGKPKGVNFTHAQVFDNAMSVIVVCGIDFSTRFLVSYPHNSTGVVNHIFGPTIMMGGTIVVDEAKNFSAEHYFSVVERHRVTHSQLVPTMLYRLLEFPGIEKFDYSSLRSVGYSSAPIPVNRVRRAQEVFGNVLIQLYGLTETCSHVAILSKDDHLRAVNGEEHLLASCGRPVWGAEVRVVDAEEKEVPRGQVGEIVLRGRWITTGYWNDPERTADTIHDGWLLSGDMARMDEHEYLYIVDRKKDLIITGGMNVASTEVEAAIYDHPAVLEAAVIGVPDTEWGERIHAVVSLRSQHSLSADELVTHCRDRLARFKCPKTVHIVDELPRTSTGKLAKAELRKGTESGSHPTV